MSDPTDGPLAGTTSTNRSILSQNRAAVRPCGVGASRAARPTRSPPCPGRPTSTGDSPRTTSRARAPMHACCTRPGCSTTTPSAAMLDALDRLRADVESGAFTPDDADEDVHTALERGLMERAGADVGGPAAGGALAQRPGGDAVPHVPPRARAGRRRPRARRRRRARRAVDPPPRRRDAGPHPPPARPAGAAVAPPARPRVGAAARRRPAARLGPAGRGLALRLGCPRRLLAGARPGGGGRRPGLRRLGRELDRRHREP